jgi:iron(III) transport system ATP-binding protein
MVGNSDSKPVIIRNLTKTYDHGKVLAVDNVNLEVEVGRLTTFLGPSGCGKTTLLRCVAGLETPEEGEIYFGDTPVFSSSRKLNVKPEKRNIGMVFQSYSIWPHLTVFENVAFPLKLRRVSGDSLVHKVEAALAKVDLLGFEKRFPSQLSGGQQQRVAIARAISTEPKLLLFDEPLSNLDFKLREHMRFELVKLQKELEITSIYVTHDQTEAMVIADEIVIMKGGRFVQIGEPREIYSRPANRFVADFIGLSNFISGRIKGHGQSIWVESEIGPIRIIKSDFDLPEGSMDHEVTVSVRPENIEILRDGAGEGTNTYGGEVERAVYLGDKIYYQLKVNKVLFRVQTHPDNLFSVGEKVFLRVNPEKFILIGPR